MSFRILLVGFGNVGRNLVSLIDSRRELLKDNLGIELSVAGVGTRTKGTVYNSKGVDLKSLIRTEKFTGRIDSISQAGSCVGLSVEDLLNDMEYDLLVETTPCQLETGQPAFSFIQKAMKRKKHVVTSNKGPIFHYFREIREMAEHNGVKCLFEGTVMAGTPLFSFAKECLCCSEILGFEGVLNGTSNYILGLMANGAGFDNALLEAKRRGYAEPDAVLDVDGWDSAVKASIVAQAVMGAPYISFDEMEIEGIRTAGSKMFEEAQRYGGSLRLLATVERKGDSFGIRVSPSVLPSNHPLHSVSGVTNGALFLTDTIGEVCVTGAGAGSRQTAYAVLRDIINVCKKEGI